MATRSEGGAPPQETSRTPAVKDLALPVLGGLIVAGLSGLYYAKVMVPLLSPFYIGNTYWTQLQGSGSLPLFGDLVLLGGRLGFGADGLAVAAASVCLVFSLSTYFLLTKSMGRWYVGLVGAAMLLFSPAFLSAIQYASYSVLLGLSLAFLSLHFAARLMKKASEWRLAVLTVLALATGLADPAIGQVLLATLLLMTPLAIWSGNSRFAAATALAAVVTLPALILVHPGPDLPWGNTSSLLLLLAGGVASLAVYFNWKERSEGVLPLALLSVAAAGASAVLGTQYVFFALILTSAALAAKVWGLYGTTSDGGRRVSHLDLGKLAALLLVLLILGSDLGFALSSYRAATAEDSALAARYGSTGLIQAMSWLKQDTPTNSLILSEYPLSQWVQAVGDRPVISDSPQNSTLQSFYESYDANTMLNSTYELRNGYMRVRDWAPIAPQRSPSISIASGGQYLDALYVDENHLNLLSPGGQPILVPYANYTKLSSGFTYINGSLALQQRYVIDGVNLDRDVFMGSGAQVTVEYVVRANQTGLISGAQIQLWVSTARSIGYTSLSNGTLQLDTDAGNMLVTSRGPDQTVTFGPDKVYGQDNLFAKFNTAASSFSFSLTVTGQNVKKLSWAKGLESITTLSLFQRYGVSYVIVPTIVKKENLDLFGLYYPTFTSVYQSSTLTIYQVIAGGAS